VVVVLARTHSTSKVERINLRVPFDNLNRLRKISYSKHVSLNNLTNQIVKQHLEWHRLAADGLLYYVQKPLIHRIFDRLTNQQSFELAEITAKEDFVESARLLKGKLTIPLFISALANWLKMSHVPYRFIAGKGKYKFIIEHGMGRHYSYFLKEICRTMLEDIFETETVFFVTDNAVAFSCKEKEQTGEVKISSN
jgi:hypothetical protein